MASVAKMAFDQNVLRSRHFLTIHQNAHARVGAPGLPLRELPRAAVVFSVGAFDAYLSAVAGEKIVARLAAAGGNNTIRDVMSKVARDLPGLAIEVALLPAANDRLAYVQNVVVDHFQTGVSAHGSKAVARIVEMLDGSTAKVWQDVSGKGFVNPAKALDDWTVIRHSIVHRGDRPKLRRERATVCIDLIAAIGQATDAEIERH